MCRVPRWDEEFYPMLVDVLIVKVPNQALQILMQLKLLMIIVITPILITL